MSKERLVELITQISCISEPDTECLAKKKDYCEKCGKVFIEHDDINRVADYLLANGVIVPPCKGRC